ncbi:MAG: 6-bladed beta-propeller [Candidatus Aminicenantes bacterium]|nr:6-bladed beta-propeller [Candidatus Aminicenantes bacterium]
MLKNNKKENYSFKRIIKNLLLFILVSILTFSCGGSGKIKTNPAQGKDKGYIFYPSLPNMPRYQYLKTFSTSDDIKKKKSKFFKFVAGADQEKPKVIKKAYGVDIYDGVIYVCDFGSGVVSVLDLKDRSFGFIGLSGSGKLQRPINLKVDKENKLLYVTDMRRRQVIVYTLKGKPVKFYGKTDQFAPSDVDFHGNKLFVCDVKEHCVHVLDKESGETLYKIGKAGSSEGELFHPTNICIHNERLYVSETTNFRVSIFDLKGKFITMYGELGKRPGNFSRNKGIAVDKEGRIYVVDAAFQNLQVFSPEFELLLFFLKGGMARDNIYMPAAVTIDYDNIEYFKEYISPKFKAEYLLFVTSHFGINKVNVYAFGSFQK